MKLCQLFVKQRLVNTCDLKGCLEFTPTVEMTSETGISVTRGEYCSWSLGAKLVARCFVRVFVTVQYNVHVLSRLIIIILPCQ